MTTRAEAIRHLWTHKTQNHPWLTDEQLVIDRAEGVWVWTEDGKKLMDGFAGLAVVNVGHGRREIAEAIAEQTVRLAYYPTTRQFSNRPAAELAAKLATLTPGDLDYTLFATSGSEANERAMQIARHYWIAKGKPDKHKVLSLQGGYHGATMGTFAVCGLPHMTVAKGITSGYLPLSGTIARGRLADAFDEHSTQETVHPNTYAAHPVACAAALANLQIMEKDRLVENAATMGHRLLDGLQQAVGKNRIVGEVRGRGLLVCAELVAPDGSGKPLDAALVATLDRKAWDRGAIVYARGQVVRLAPPLCITAAEVDRLVEVVGASIDELDRELTR